VASEAVPPDRVLLIAPPSEDDLQAMAGMTLTAAYLVAVGRVVAAEVAP
jgi:hypothetical protein